MRLHYIKLHKITETFYIITCKKNRHKSDVNKDKKTGFNNWLIAMQQSYVYQKVMQPMYAYAFYYLPCECLKDIHRIMHQ